MASLADLPELVGFFSYSRSDDEHSQGALSRLRARIHSELRLQLGRSLRLWQDTAAIPDGSLWADEIKRAIAESVFFIPIVTPSAVGSVHCKFEFDSFLKREQALGRQNLVFPILYIRVPALEDEQRRQENELLKVICARQYADWQKLRLRDWASTEVAERTEQFCRDIVEALHQPWLSPEERQRKEQAEAVQRAEEEARRHDEERRRQTAAEAERQRRERETAAKREAEEHARQAVAAEAERQRQERDAAAARDAEERARQEERRRQDEDEKRRREAEAERQRAEAQRLRTEAEAKHRAEEEERRRLRRSQARPPWPPSRPVLAAGALLGVVLLGAIGAWFALSPTPAPVTPAPPAPAAAPMPQAANAPLSVAQEHALRPGDTFQECTNCPKMMVVPAGSFTMGSPASEPGRSSDEGPQHTVTIGRQFAVGQYELTFDEWDACVADGGCDGYKPSDQGWGRGSRPVINVSWDDASAYVAWLAKKTDKPYRLLTEAEYEYATRAGTTTAYPWGNAIGSNNANCDGCGSQWDNKQTAPVGSFAANGFGLYDMAGNVWEWTEDCYHDSYNGAPADGSAWTSGDCAPTLRVLRGGSWDDVPRDLRSADRVGLTIGLRGYAFGFRVARTLVTP